MDMAVSGICLCHQELLGRAAGQGQSGRPTGNVHGMGVPGQAILHRLPTSLWESLEKISR